jgi:hypothetical protein
MHMTGGIKLIWTIIGILVLLWIAGLVLDIAGGLIHVLLVVALVVFIFNMMTGRKA